MFNMEDILARLQNGEKIDDIGNEIAAMMNAAVAAHQAELDAEAAKQAEVEKEAAKRDLIEELIEIIQELAILEGMDPADMQTSDEEVEQLIAAFSEMFAAMRDLKKMFAGIEARVDAPARVHPGSNKISPMAPSDEQILADFLKMFN